MEFQVGDKVRCTLKENDENPLGVFPEFFGATGKIIALPDGDKDVWGAGYQMLRDNSSPGDYNYILPSDLQYIFQEGDIVKIHPQKSWTAGQIHKGHTAVVSEVTGSLYTVERDKPFSCNGEIGTTIYNLDEDQLELVDRAPKSDAEQCCNTKPAGKVTVMAYGVTGLGINAGEHFSLGVKEFLATWVKETEDWTEIKATRVIHDEEESAPFKVGDRVVVTDETCGINVGDPGRVTGFTTFCGEPHIKVVMDDGTDCLFLNEEIALAPADVMGSAEGLAKTRHVPGVKCNDPDECDSTCFPVDEPASEYFDDHQCSDFGFSATVAGDPDEDFSLAYCDVKQVLKRLNGDVEVKMYDDKTIVYKSGLLTSWCSPDEITFVEVLFEAGIGMARRGVLLPTTVQKVA